MTKKKSKGWQTGKKKHPTSIQKAGKLLEKGLFNVSVGGLTPEVLKYFKAAIRRHEALKNTTGTKKDLGKKTKI